MSEKSNDIIYELLKEVKSDLKEDIKNVFSKVENIQTIQIQTHVQYEEIKDRLENLSTDVNHIKEENIIQTKDIAANKDSLVEHMENNKLLKQLIDKTDDKLSKEIDTLKTPAIAKAYILKVAGGIGVLTGAVYGIYRLVLAFGINII